MSPSNRPEEPEKAPEQASNLVADSAAVASQALAAANFVTQEFRFDKNSLPPMSRDRSFLGMTATQFLGAFNDNMYKQLVLLIALDYKQLNGWDSDPYQPVATFVFAIPFVLLCGFGGYISDKLQKRKVVIFCKVLEVFVMMAAMIAFMTGTPGSPVLMISLLLVLLFMASQSALFGPSKYGILPEMLRERDLPKANGVIQMTTFLAIIFGTAMCGVLKDMLPGHLWVISAVCILIAVAGTLTSLLVRPTPVANPTMKLSLDCLVVEKTALRFILSDRPLVHTMLVYALFWFAGAVMMLAINVVAKDQLGYSDSKTSLAQAFIGSGIAIGCVVCGRWCGGRVRFDLVRRAGTGLLMATGLTSLICVASFPDETIRYVLMCLSLAAIGFFAGVFAVPPQVFIQTRPPANAKGRVIGAMGLTTWIGITLATAWYYLLSMVTAALQIPPSWMFLSIGLLFVVVVLLFRQPNPPLSEAEV